MTMRVESGLPFPLGATWDGWGVNFALFSANAEKVELCLFDSKGRREVARIALPENTHEVWHGYLPEVRPGQLYGYRVYGPYDPKNGHRFNHHKLLLDPYAVALKGEIRWHDAVFGYSIGSRREDLSFDRRDSAFVMPKCVVIDRAVTWGRDRPPERPWSETIIYEAHVKGMTARHPDVPEHWRGTFAGLANPKVIEHLVKLGVTAVELMPVQAFFDDRHLIEKGLVNYWGYNTIGYFAPASRYISSQGDIHEFKLMVARLHEAGIEVLMDVVYNHTAEGDQLGPTLSFRGIDNASYYILGDDPRYYFDMTGCGNTLNFQQPRVLQMAMDSLRYWVEECRVDGFRFDLASSLGRERHEFDPSAGFFAAVRQDPVLSRVKMIAEPWDVGPDGYQLGSFPPSWAEWNDRYRDSVRGFWRGDEGAMPALGSSLLASAEIFDRHGRRPWSCVNFVTAHDGFTLADLVSYEHKHNEANLEGNADGHDHNLSMNFGVEGDSDDPEILELRDRMRRNLVATLLLSHGTPMLLMGDETGRTQRGNNNAYCQDAEINWLRWAEIEPRDAEFHRFVCDIVALRRSIASLQHGYFLHGSRMDGSDHHDALWLRPDGEEMQDADWHEGGVRSVGLLLALPDARSFFAIFNAGCDPVSFVLPLHEVAARWNVVLDTARGVVRPGDPPSAAGRRVTVADRCVVALETTDP
jgi:glycogen operon protein